MRNSVFARYFAVVTSALMILIGVMTLYPTTPVYADGLLPRPPEPREYNLEWRVEPFVERLVLAEGYTEADAEASKQTVIIKNVGTKSITVKPANLKELPYTNEAGMTQSAVLVVEPVAQETITLAPGEEAAVATIKPVAGKPFGHHSCELSLPADGVDYTMMMWAGYDVMHKGFSAELFDGSVDFGRLKIGFTNYPTPYMYLDNTGTVPFKIVDVTAPEDNHLFTVLGFGEEVVMPGAQLYDAIHPGLDLNHPNAKKVGTYTGTYIVTVAQTDEAGVLVKPGATEQFTIEATVTIVAKKHTITFDLDGGTWNGKTGTVKMAYEEGTVITLPEPTKDGYVFSHWEGSHYNAGESYTVTEDHTLTAKWLTATPPGRNYAPVTWDPAGGTLSDATYPFEKSTETILQPAYLDTEHTVLAAPTREGYTFLYWECEGKQYTPNEEFTVSKRGMVFTAKWEKNGTVITGDETNLQLPWLLLMASAVVITLLGYRHRKNEA